MPLALKVQPELDESSFGDIQGKVESIFDVIGRGAGGEFMRGLSDGIGQGQSGIGAISAAAESMGGKFSTAGVAAASSFAAIAAAAVIVTDKLYDVGARFDEITDKITIRTGAVGAQLDSLSNSMMTVASTTASSFEQIGDIIGKLNVSLDLTGAPLEKLTGQIANLDRMTGEAVNIRDFSLALKTFDEAGNASDNLDALAAASQRTLLPLNELLSQIKDAGPAAQTLGLDFGETANLMTSLEDAGINVQRTYTALNTAAKVFADNNIDMKTGLADTITQIKAFTDAGNDAAAVDLAGKVFGERNAQKWVQVVREGVLTVDTLNTGLDSSGGHIDELNSHTADLSENWTIFQNRVTELAEQAGGPLFRAFNSVLGVINDIIAAPLPDISGIQGAPLPKGYNPGSVGSLLIPGYTPTPGQPGGPPAAGATPAQGGASLTDLYPSLGPAAPAAPAGGWPDLPKPQDIAGALADKPKGGAGPKGDLVPFDSSYGVMDPGESPEHFKRRMTVLERQHDVAEKQAELDALEASGTAKEEQLIAARNDVAQARVRATEAEQSLAKPETPGKLDKPEVPYGPGYGAPIDAGETLAHYNAEQRLLEAQHTKAEAAARLQQLEQSGVATANDLVKARNDLQKAESAEYEAQLKLIEASNKSSKSLDDMGASLDKDLGLSRGLPGLADNLVRFIGSIAAAPLMGPLNAISSAQGGIGKTGSGLAGYLWAQAHPDEAAAMDTSGVPTTSSSTTSGAPVSAAMIGMPSILQDTGSVPSGPQSRYAATMIQQLFGSEIRGKIGGSRDENTAKNTHDTGTSIDIPIAEDQRGPGGLGDQINAWLQANAANLGLKYSIWRDKGQNVGGGQFDQPGHQNHIDAHFNGDPNSMRSVDGSALSTNTSGATPVFVVNMPGGGIGAMPGGLMDANSMGAMNSASMSDPGQIAKMIYGMAAQRGYSQHDAQSIVAYAIGESSLNPKSAPGAQGGTGAANEVQGLFQQKPDFARGGGIDPSQRMDPYYNTLAYLNQLEANRGLPIEQALPTTSVGGPLAKGGEQPWGPLMQRAAGLLGLPYQVNDEGVFGPTIGTGATVVQNNTGKPEHVLTGDQLKSIGQGPNVSGVGAPAGPAPGPPSGSTPGQQGPTEIGGGEKKPVPGGGASAGAGGGLMGAATSAASMAADAFAPGSGQAVQVASQMLQRTIKLGGQLSGVLAGGLMETFLPTGASDLANNSWLTRIGGAFAGASPQIPNTAGKPQTPVKQTQAPPPLGMPNAPGNKPEGQGNTVNVTLNGVGDVKDTTLDSFTREVGATAQAAMSGGGVAR